jgi:transcriptional regulator with XRE-family HTH domain
LRLLTAARSGRAGTAKMLVLDISTSGFLVQSNAPFEKDERIEIELPGTGAHEARVVWASGIHFGCSFERSISPAAVSAALLKGLPGDTAAAESETAVPFSQRLAAVRREHGWSIEELAERLGVSRQAVWYWESGQRLPRPAMKKRFASEFGMPENEVLADGRPDGPAGATTILEEFRRRIATAIGANEAKITISIEF